MHAEYFLHVLDVVLVTGRNVPMHLEHLVLDYCHAKFGYMFGEYSYCVEN